MKTPIAVALVASISLVTACGSTSQKVGDYVLTNDASGLVPDNSIAPGLALRSSERARTVDL